MKKQVLIFILLFSQLAFSQSEFDYSKSGKFIYEKVNFGNHENAPEIVAFERNAKQLINFFTEQVPFLKANKGFDLHVVFSGQDKYDDTTQKRVLKAHQYSLNAELRFLFELFLNNGKKWTNEPPEFRIYINETETGSHGGLYNDGDDNSFLKKTFLVFPIVKEIAPGVHYYNCEAQTCGQIVVFNPNRPAYWLPVTVRQMVLAKLKFYNTGNTADKAVYNFIKPIIDAMSEKDLDAPAFYGSEDAILNVNGKGQGLQIMRFNPEYWDRTLPASAIQYFTIAYNEFGYNGFNESDWQKSKEEYFRNNGHIEFWQEVTHAVDLKILSAMIQK